MVFPSLGNHFSREFVLRNISHIGRGFEMIERRKRLERSLKQESMEMNRRRT
jgi:hypothetical protein